MSRAELPSRRTLLAAAVVATVAGSAAPASAGNPTAGTPATGAANAGRAAARTVDNRAWTSYTDWRGGAAAGAPAGAGAPPRGARAG
ncbi:peptidase C39 family protein, partial [Streptomyces sp. NPDC004976]